MLRCRYHPAMERQIGQKRLDLGCMDLARMALAVEQAEAPDPEDLWAFRTNGVGLRSEPLAYRIKEARRWGSRPRKRRPIEGGNQGGA